MHSKIAIDIVLLPSTAVMQECIDLIDYKHDSVIKLDTKDCLPHISLAMGVMNIDDMSKIQSILRSIAANFKPLTLQLTSTRSHTIPNGKEISHIDVAPSRVIADLFSQLKGSLAPHLTHDVEISMFYSPPTVDPISTTWVEHYYANNSPEDFQGHITLGEGTTRQLDKNIEIEVTQLALCHLGNYCTCRKVLDIFRLG